MDNSMSLPTPATTINENMPTPTFLAPVQENIPAELKARHQWVAWKAAWNTEKGKWDKIPLNPQTGRGASTVNPATWGTFEQAMRFYNGWLGREHSHESKVKEEYVTLTGPVAGIGFVLSTKVPLLEGSAPLVGIDLDHCIDEHGIIADWAQEIISTVNSYTELSPSGTGIRIFVKGTLAENGCKVGSVEMYQQGRYLTVTGRIVPRMEAAQ